MNNKKQWMYEKLNRLVKLCKATEPDQPDDKHLFMPTIIDAYDMLSEVQERYDNMTPTEIKDMMMEANKIWRFRRKIWNGDVDWNWQTQLDQELEDMLKQGAKIAAIKYYREVMNTHFNEEVTLRQSKEFVDAIQSDMQRSGIIKK